MRMNGRDQGPSRGYLDDLFVATSAVTVDHEPPSAGAWAGLGPYFRIELRDYADFPNGVPLQTLMDTYGDEIREEILEAAPRYFPFNTYSDGIRTVQGILPREVYRAPLRNFGPGITR